MPRKIGEDKKVWNRYIGCTWIVKKQHWQVYLIYKQVRIFVGCFKDVKKAARAYDEAAIKYIGPTARTNFAQRR